MEPFIIAAATGFLYFTFSHLFAKRQKPIREHNDGDDFFPRRNSARKDPQNIHLPFVFNQQQEIVDISEFNSSFKKQSKVESKKSKIEKKIQQEREFQIFDQQDNNQDYNQWVTKLLTSAKQDDSLAKDDLQYQKSNLNQSTKQKKYNSVNAEIVDDENEICQTKYKHKNLKSNSSQKKSSDTQNNSDHKDKNDKKNNNKVKKNKKIQDSIISNDKHNMTLQILKILSQRPSNQQKRISNCLNQLKSKTNSGLNFKQLKKQSIISPIRKVSEQFHSQSSLH